MKGKGDLEPKLLQYMLDKEYIVLPTICLKQKMILELECILRKGNPTLLSNFFKKVNKNFDNYISVKNIKKLFKKIKELSRNENFQKKISEDDKKIIEFLFKNTNINILDVLQIIGQGYFTLQVAEELEKTDNLSNILKMALLLWCFVNIYELILVNVDRRLLLYLKNNHYDKDPNIERFLNKVNREHYKDHATADLINKVFCKILNLKEENTSIFGQSSKSKLIRNKISHSNLFYDSEKNKIVLINSQEYSIKDFLGEYYKLFIFLVEWINRELGENSDDEMLVVSLKKLFHAISSSYLKIERGGSRKSFFSYIIKLKKQAGINDD
jgi:hypothetical protein